ncbi:hypothetical protein [Trabulsiella odontotermitis]|uniref:Uncharacterized protein n=1 Tax=Trabulsiella odontotermitis TaxID=379893 RepID=A0A0L0GYI3_9ENTR|nr:hypothetical protein [Trabulsiella odontotermitis]KNC93761.1 hypothetical protein GM31_18240 [Trabulsiella odontotermitis]
MKLEAFVRNLALDGLLVLSISDGEVVDFLVTAAAARTVIHRDKGGLSACILEGDDSIIKNGSMADIIQMLKTVK